MTVLICGSVPLRKIFLMHRRFLLPGNREAGAEAARPGQQGHEHDTDLLRRHVHRGLGHPALPSGLPKRVKNLRLKSEVFKKVNLQHLESIIALLLKAGSLHLRPGTQFSRHVTFERGIRTRESVYRDLIMDPDPSLFVRNFHDANKKLVFLLITYLM